MIQTRKRKSGCQLNNKFEIKLHFLDISKEIRKERILKRNTEKGKTFEFAVSEGDFEFMETWFETPKEKELIGGSVIRN